jgi:tetratricopeptide (TPR) repeat protein
MHLLLLLSIVTLPAGEARVNGLADACVTIADQPLALYVNPALLTSTSDSKLLFNPTGFGFRRPEWEFQWDDFAQRVFDAYTQIGFIGYTQPFGDFGAGLAGFQDETQARGLLLGAAYRWRFLQTGASLGIRYLNYDPGPDESRLKPAFALGISIPDIKFEDVPGEISVAAAVRKAEWFGTQVGMDYNIAFFRFLTNFNLREPFNGQIRQGTVHLAGLFTLKDLLGIPLEVGGGWASDNRFGVLTAVDLTLCRINLSYSQIPASSIQPNGRLAFSFLFNIASTREVEERLASIEGEKRAKNRITSKTYTTQGIDSYNDGAFDDAIHAFDVALIWDPANDEALNWLQRVKEEKNTSELRALIAAANAAMRTADYLEAMSKAEAALKIDSTSTQARSLAEEAQRKFSESILAQTSSVRNAGEINALYQKGLEQYAAGEYTEAAETWEKIEKLQPRSKTVETYKKKTSEKLGQQIAEGMKRLESLERKGQWLQALNLAKQLKALAPSNREIAAKITSYQGKIHSSASDYESQGIDYYNRGYYVQAQSSFYALLAVDPDNAAAKDYLTRIKSRLQKKDADELYLQGVQAYTNNNYKQAINYWEQVLAIDPSYGNATRNIQRAKEKLEQLK